MIKMFEPQQRAAAHLRRILALYQGALLNGQEGTGKTLILHNLSQDYKKVLYIAPAKDLKDIKEKWSSYGKSPSISFMSYNGFTDIKKNSVEFYNSHDLIIFDEINNIRNWGAKAKTLTMRKPKSKYIFASATPFIKKPLDGMYWLLKTGVFGNKKAKWFKEYYFNAKPSPFHSGLEIGEFQNKEDFYTHLDLISARITHNDINKFMPPLKFKYHVLEGEYEYTGDIEKETETAVEAGAIKAPQAAEIIKKINPSSALILCKFHETAKLMQKELGWKTALNNKELYKIQKEDKIITTLGLSSSSFDMNHINNVFLVESTYSFPQDRQSISRTRRIGKKDDVTAHYFSLEGEHTFTKSMERQYLTDIAPAHARYAPSSLSRLRRCPGSFWLPRPELDDLFLNAGTIGNIYHDQVERYLKNPKASIPAVVNNDTVACIMHCRKMIAESDMAKVEERVYGKSIHEDLFGHIDLTTYCKNKKLLTICDFKSGNHKVKVDRNIQLLAYAYMAVETYSLKPDKVMLKIFQKGEPTTATYPASILQEARQEIEDIIAKVKEAKPEPLKHLDPKCSDPYCACADVNRKKIDDYNHICGKAIWGKLEKLETKRGKVDKLSLLIVAKEVPAEVLEKVEKIEKIDEGYKFFINGLDKSVLELPEDIEMHKNIKVFYDISKKGFLQLKGVRDDKPGRGI